MRTPCTICRMQSAQTKSQSEDAYRRLSLRANKEQLPDFWLAVDGLKNLVPPAFPVDVRIVRLGVGRAGDCVRNRSRFEIRISSRLDLDNALETLCHEWAHALAWNHLDDKMGRSQKISRAEFQELSHGPTWGCAYSVVYRTYVNKILPNLKDNN